MTKPIGLLGGTFDPIHLGHLHLAQTLLTTLDFQAIHFIPCYQPVHRTTPQASALDRMKMVELAIQAQPGLIADPTEIKRQGPSYMIDTLKTLRAQFPSTPLALIFSSESFEHFFTWKDWQDFLKLCHIVVANRQHLPLLSHRSVFFFWVFNYNHTPNLFFPRWDF